MGKRAISASVVIALAFGMMTLTAGSASAAGSQERSFLSKLNSERKARGLRALTLKSDLSATAERQSNRMRSKGDIFHNRNLANEVRGNWRLIGENVGAGYGVSSLHEAFMDSPSHRANVLRSAFNQVGVGSVMDGDVIYVTFVFAKRNAVTVKATKKIKTRVKVTKPRVKIRKIAPKKRPVATQAPTQRRAQSTQRRAQSVDVLVRMIGLDATNVDPATGYAAGF